MSQFNTLIVGDLHAMPSNMEDTGLILDRVREIVESYDGLENVVFLGDIFHTHSVVRQEVAHFVKQKIIAISEAKPAAKRIRVFLMAGNHDGHSPHSVKLNSVRLVFDEVKGGIIIVDNEDEICWEAAEDGFSLVPFIGNNDKFVSLVQKSAPILFCHNTILGAHYENKHLAVGGIDQELLPQELLICGHIHMEQTVGRAWFPGTPRALNANECNQSKGVWLFHTKTRERFKITTDDIVKLFIRYDIEEGKLFPQEIETATWKVKDDVRIYVTGSEAFYAEVIEKYYEKLKGKAKFVPNIKKALSNALDVEADGQNMYSALHKYVFNIYDADELAKGKVWQKLQDLIPNLGDRA